MRRRVRMVIRPRPARMRAVLAAVAAAAIALSGAGAAQATASVQPASDRIGGQPSTVVPHAASKQSADVAVYTGGNGVMAPGQDLALTIVITNTGTQSLAPSSIPVAITSSSFAQRSDLNGWLAHADNPPATRTIGTTSVGNLSPGGSVTVPLTIPAAGIGIDRADTAVYGISAEVIVGSDSVGRGTGSIVWNTGSGFGQTGVAIATPLTAPVTGDGLITAANLATYTADNGILTRELNGVLEHPTVAIALDPMILASIRVLGSAAPPSATAWLEQLQGARNDIFPLQYGDADLAGEVQAGSTTLLGPISFDYAMDPADHKADSDIGETPTPTPTPTGGQAGSQTPTPTPTTSTGLPSMAQLLSWPYTRTDIAWPADDTVRTEDLPVFAKNKLTTTILDGSNTNASTLKVTANAALAVSGGRAAVADSEVSAALRAAATASSDSAWSEAMATLSAQMAMIGSENNAGQVILATLGRGGPTSWPRMSQTFSAVLSMPWSHAATLANAIGSTATSGLEVKSTPESDARIASITGLLGRESGTAPDGRTLTNFSTVLTDPTALTGPSRNELMSLLAAGWLNQSTSWPAAVSASLSASDKILDSVQIVPPGNVSQLSNEVLIPITVSNKFDLPVNIVLRTTPSNGRLEIDSDTEKAVPAKATAKLLVPVKAKVGNGKVQLTMELFSPTGIRIGATQKATVNVHADWEGLGALVIGILAVLLLGFGLFRSIRRRRRERAVEAEESTDESEPLTAGPDGAASAEDPPNG